MQNDCDWERKSTLELCPFKIILRTLVSTDKSHGTLECCRIQPESYCPSGKRSRILNTELLGLNSLLNHVPTTFSLRFLNFDFFSFNLHNRKNYSLLLGQWENSKWSSCGTKFLENFISTFLSALSPSLLHVGFFFLHLCLCNIYRAESV